MVHKRNRLIIILLAVLVVGLGVAGVYGAVYWNKISAEQAMANGLEAEKRGDTEKALVEYKKAGEQCAPKDDRCRVDMQMKVSLMTEALENERSAKVGEPVQGAEKIDLTQDEAPSDEGLVENR